MASRAVLSFLGFPSWGPLHLWLPGKADPPAFALRLRQALPAGEPLHPAHLLTAFLRRHGDLEPLIRLPDPARIQGEGALFRYRIVCRSTGTARLSVRAERWSVSPPGWHSSCRPMRIGSYVERFGESAHSRPAPPAPDP